MGFYLAKRWDYHKIRARFKEKYQTCTPKSGVGHYLPKRWNHHSSIVVPIIISPKVVFLYPCNSIGLKGCFASNEKLVWGQRWLHMMTLLARGKSFLAIILLETRSRTSPFDCQDFQVRCWHRVNIVRAACNGGEIKIEVGFIITK